MSSAMARGSATQPPKLTPERAELLEVRAYTLDRIRALEVSPQRESESAPPLAVSKDVAAETLSRSENTETDLSARVTIGDEVSPLTIDTSIPVSTENSGSLHGRRLRRPLLPSCHDRHRDTPQATPTPLHRHQKERPLPTTGHATHRHLIVGAHAIHPRLLL